MKKLYIIKCGSTFESMRKELDDFEHWIINKFENKDIDVSIIDAKQNSNLPMPRKTDSIILTGSHSMVTD